ncbi:hypothetical protein [Pseudomonas abyssi]|uniref:hypothetical protein n=1 Tax=Pseudomonas TaxID=286 RepID=UPI000C904CC4|nr:hypothetical protein [Pseudomonadales bacterium]|tara:strand:- start:1284 stop:1475 length:192 start_codon:yes stop_codon:yes gene_type:complete
MKNLSALIIASFLASSPAVQADDDRHRLSTSDRSTSQSTGDYLQGLIEAQARADGQREDDPQS